MTHIMESAGSFWRMIIVFFTSCLPFCESKGSIILANMFHLRMLPSGIVSVTGSFVPVPFILRGKSIPKAEAKSEKRANLRKYIEHYGCWALLAMTAIPCTGVGVWLGAILARVAGVNRKKAAAAIFVGNAIATLMLAMVLAGIHIVF